jgi:glycosyltransferase involved in cell wall biosynthesis
MTLNVAQVIFSGSYAGAERVACLLTEALQPYLRSSLLYLIIERRSGADRCRRLSERVRRHPIEVREFSADHRLSRSLWRDLQRQSRTDGLDVVHCHSYKAAVYFGGLGRLDRAAPQAAFTLHGMDLARWRDHAYVQGLNLLGAYLCDAVVACSWPIERSYRRFPGLGQKSRTIRNGIIPGSGRLVTRNCARAKIAARLGLPSDMVWLGCVGRLVAVKNHRLLLAAFADLLSHCPRIRLLFIGDGPLESELRQQVADLGLSHAVLFTGYVDDVDEWYPGLDVVVLTSTTEGTPMVLLEAGQCGVPVVASRVGGVPDLVRDGETGVLFPSGDRDALTQALWRVLTDARERQALGEAARVRVEREFSGARWGLRHAELYRSLAQPMHAQRKVDPLRSS